MLEAVVEPGVNVTEQLPVVRLQVGAENVPAPPLLANVTVPVGVVAPTPLVSAIVAVQVEAWPIGKVEGAHDSIVLVVLRVPVTVDAALVLVAWVESPPYVAVTLDGVVVPGEKVTEQVPASRAHVSVENVPAPPVPAKDTVPVGAVAPTPLVSASVAVQVEA